MSVNLWRDSEAYEARFRKAPGLSFIQGKPSQRAGHRVRSGTQCERWGVIRVEKDGSSRDLNSVGTAEE